MRDRAVRLYGAAAAIRSAAGAPVRGADAAALEERITRLREVLDPSFLAVWAEGAGTDLAVAVSHACEDPVR